jgi:hypothetical protein
MGKIDTKMTELADAIRGKGWGVPLKLSVDDMIQAVNKMPDVTDIDTLNTAPEDVSIGKKYYVWGGILKTGKMPDAVISRSEDNSKINITAGRLREAQEFAVGGSGGGGSNVVLGQVNADGDFQALAFSGTEASNSGDPETVEEYYTYKGVLPVPAGGIHIGGSADYYKCVSVDTENKTWTGYKAVLTDGVYIFEDAVTEGLSYGAGFTPTVGKVYDSNASACAKLFTDVIPTQGLLALFNTETTQYNPSSGKGITNTGQPIQWSSGNNHVVIDSGSVWFSMNSGIETVNIFPNLPSGDADRTMCCKVKLPSNSSERYCLFSYGSDSPNELYALEIRDNRIAVCGGSDANNEGFGNTSFDTSQEHHLAIVHKDSVDYFYLDGNPDGFFTYARNTNSNSRLFFGVGPYSVSALNGYCAQWMLYDRALTNDEISAICEENNPVK